MSYYGEYLTAAAMDKVNRIEAAHDGGDVAVGPRRAREPRYELLVRAPELEAGEWVPSSFGENWPLTWREVSDAWHEAIASPGACWRVYAVVVCS